MGAADHAVFRVVYERVQPIGGHVAFGIVTVARASRGQLSEGGRDPFAFRPLAVALKVIPNESVWHQGQGHERKTFLLVANGLVEHPEASDGWYHEEEHYKEERERIASEPRAEHKPGCNCRTRRQEKNP